MGENHTRAMSLELATRAIDRAVLRGKELHGGALDVSFFGGEPLLAWDTLVAVASYARARARARAAELGLDVRLQVTTNGTLLDDARVETFADLRVRATLSMDGGREAHDRAPRRRDRPASRSPPAEPEPRSAARAPSARVVARIAHARTTPKPVRRTFPGLSNVGSSNVSRSSRTRSPRPS